MKELSIEEKARRYDEAIEIANNLHKDAVEMENNMTTKTCEIIFPELKDEDERIRKELLSFFTERAKYTEDSTFNGLSSKEIVTWLEKQAEQKPLNKIKIGKEYKCIASPIYTAFIKGNIYKPEDEFVCSLMNFCSDCFEPIEDNEKKPTEEYNITGIKSRHAEGKLGEMIKNLKPVNEVLEQKPADNQFTPEQAGILDKHIDKFLEQNPWSEEDEKILNYLLWFYDTRFRWNDICHDDIKFGDIVTFLKSLKDRVQPKQEWSDKDEKMIHHIENAIKYDKSRTYLNSKGIEIIDVCNWLKSLRPRSQWKPSDKHYELEEFAKIVRCNLTGISKAVQELFEAKYLQLTGNKMYEGFKD